MSSEAPISAENRKKAINSIFNEAKLVNIESIPQNFPLVQQVENKLSAYPNLEVLKKLEFVDDIATEEIIFVAAPTKPAIMPGEYRNLVISLAESMRPELPTVPVLPHGLDYGGYNIGLFSYFQNIGSNITKRIREIHLNNMDGVSLETYQENGYKLKSENVLDWSKEKKEDAKRVVAVHIWPAISMAKERIEERIDKEGESYNNYFQIFSDREINAVFSKEGVRDPRKRGWLTNLLFVPRPFLEDHE